MSAAILQELKRVLDIEAASLAQAAERLGEEGPQAVEILASCTGRVIVTGMGKSGIIARKIAATLSSTGTPAYFLHPAEALHGDLGMVTDQEVVIALSNSGETEEIVSLLNHLKRFGVRIIAITGTVQSSLARYSEVVLDSSVSEEGDPLQVAPMASTTTQLALGDALAAGLLVTKGFSKEQFAQYHPGGSLGRKLLLLVENVMHTDEELPWVPGDTPLRECIQHMSRHRLGCCLVTSGDAHLEGIFTDGDLRRLFQDHENPLGLPIAQIMTANPKRVAPTDLAASALRQMEEHAINVLPVVSGGKAVGVLHLQDLLKAGLN